MSSRVIAALVFSLLAFQVHAGIVSVPADHATIAAAVAAAQDGDTILISGGPYTEVISLNGRALDFLASPEGVIWNAPSDEIPCIEAGNGCDVTVRGFELKGGPSAIGVGQSDVTIENCRITGQRRFCVGAGSNEGGVHTLTVRNCFLQSVPVDGRSHGGIRIDNFDVRGVFENNIIISTRGTLGFGMLVLDGSESFSRNNTISNANYGLSAGNPNTRHTATGNRILNCTNALHVDRDANFNAGNLSNPDTTDDGGNVIFPSNDRYIVRAESGTTMIAEGNFLPRLDAAHLTPRITGNPDATPSFQLLIDRVAAIPDIRDNYSSTLAGQWFELRLATTAPTSHAADIGGWLISDDPSLTQAQGLFTIPASTELAAGRSLALVYSSSEIFQTHVLTSSNEIIEMTGSPLPVLKVIGDELFLSPDPREVMDAFLFGVQDDPAQAPWWVGARVPGSAGGAVYARNGDSVDTNTAADWTRSNWDGRALIRPRHAIVLR